MRAAQAQNWLNLNYLKRLGITGSFDSSGDLCCQVYIDVGDGDANLRIFNALQEHQQEVEDAVGGKLLWEALDGRRACRISYATPGSPTGDDTDELISWLQEHHLKFREVFWPIVEQLPSGLWG